MVTPPNSPAPLAGAILQPPRPQIRPSARVLELTRQPDADREAANSGTIIKRR